MDDPRIPGGDLEAARDRPADDTREPYEAPAVESLGGVYGQTQQTGP